MTNNNEFISFKPYKILYLNNSKYLFNSYNGALFKISAKIEVIINKCYPKISSSTFEKICNEQGIDSCQTENLTENLRKLGILRCENEYFPKKIMLSSVTLIVDEGCNLNCKYCFEHTKKSKKMSFSTAKKSIDFIASINDNINITFFGGEPLLNFGLIKKIVEYCEETYREKNIKYILITNATLINDNIASFLMDNNFSVTISLDGGKRLNDLNRVDYFGNGTFEKTVRGYKLIETIHPIIRATVTKDNSSSIKIINSLKKLKPIGIACSHGYESFSLPKDFKLIASDFAEIYTTFNKYLIKRKYAECRKIHFIMSILKKISSSNVRFSFCDACFRTITVDSNGDIYPCHRFFSSKKLLIGNVSENNEDLINKIYKCFKEEFVSPRHEKCKNCWAIGLCGSFCKYDDENFCLSNSSLCEDMKVLYEQVILLYLSLNKHDKKYLGLK